MDVQLSLTVNGKAVKATVDPRTLLVQFLRENLQLTGTHVGCDTAQCGACTVHIDGRAIKSCTMLAVQVQGSEITTIEGLAPKDGELHPMQAAFRECHGLQCGFCTPGMVMSAVQLLRRQPEGRRGGDPRGARRQHLPLHRLPEHRQVDPVLPVGRHARRGLRSTLMGNMNDIPDLTKSPIGQSLRRREDHRFLTGDGQYTDDVDAARAELTASSCARRMRTRGSAPSTSTRRRRRPACVAIFTGADLADAKVGGLPCGWLIHSKDGAPMKEPRASGARAGQGAPRRRPGRAGRRRVDRRRRRTRPS